jgi:hypothetical protein
MSEPRDPYPAPGDVKPSDRWIFFRTREEAEAVVRSIRGLADRLESGEADVQIDRASDRSQ